MKLEDMRKELKEQFIDLDIAELENEHLIIFGLPFDWYEYGNYKLIISKDKIEFKKNTEVEADLVLIAFNFRKEWFNV